VSLLCVVQDTRGDETDLLRELVVAPARFSSRHVSVIAVIGAKSFRKIFSKKLLANIFCCAHLTFALPSSLLGSIMQ